MLLISTQLQVPVSLILPDIITKIGMVAMFATVNIQIILHTDFVATFKIYLRD